MKLISRDIFYLALLIMLVKVAVSNRQNAPEAPTEYSAVDTVVMHEEPAPAPIQSSAPLLAPSEMPVATAQPAMADPAFPASATEQTRSVSYSFSDLEANLLAQIDVAQKQVDALMPHISGTSEHAAHLHSIKQKLAHLRLAYQQSLAAPLFGLQTATTSDHSVQTMLEKDLLRVVNKLGLIAHSIKADQHNFTPAESVIKGLEMNHGLLEKVIS